MADDLGTARCLDPYNFADRNDTGGAADYTNIEIYLNQLLGELHQERSVGNEMCVRSVLTRSWVQQGWEHRQYRGLCCSR